MVLFNNLHLANISQVIHDSFILIKCICICGSGEGGGGGERMNTQWGCVEWVTYIVHSPYTVVPV